MKPKVYLETTIVSYLTAWPSREELRAAHQKVTKDWWDNRRAKFELFVSQIVIREASAGDADAASQRLEVLEGLPLLEVTDDVTALAEDLVQRVPFPTKAAADAVHVAIAVVHGMDYLLTWNCTHIANATLRRRIESVCRNRGYEPLVICTPDELIGELS